jgi:hypothetical protein
MRLTIRSLAICLLMLLLSLQGIASAAGLRIMNDCPMGMMQSGDCCEHGMQMPQAAHHGDHSQHQSGQAKADVPCDMGMSCPALSGLAVLSTFSLPSLDPGSTNARAAAEQHYLSHIPEGLQRPPRLPA